MSIEWIEALGKWPDQAPNENDLAMDGDALADSIPLSEVTESELSSEKLHSLATSRQLRLEQAVRGALCKLNDEERELVERYLLAGQAMTELAELTGRRVHRLTTMYNRACRKLEKYLRPLVEQEFGMVAKNSPIGAAKPSAHACPICASGFRAEIDLLITARPAGSTWRPIIACLRTEYGIVISTPQILIGHQRYH